MAITKVKINGNWELASPASGGAVSSVNGQTGAVVLDATDVGALPSSTTIPTKVSQLQNDSGFTTNSGTVTSVRVQATSPVSSSVSTAQSTSLNTTISLASGYGDTQNPYGSKTKNQVLAAPNGSNGTPSFRALVANDIPSITKSKISDFPTAVSSFTNDAGYTTNTGTITSVRVQATSPVQSSTDTEQSTSLNTTISLASGYGDTQNPYGSKTANSVLAAPNGSNGNPSFRALAVADIPDLSSVYQKVPTVTTNTISSAKSYAYNTWTTLCTVNKPAGATFGMAFAYVGITPNGAGRVRLALGAGYDNDAYSPSTSYHAFTASGYVTANTVNLQINGLNYGGSASAASLTVVWF